MRTTTPGRPTGAEAAAAGGRDGGERLCEVSIVKETMLDARRIVLMALVGVVVIVGGILVERIYYTSRHNAMTERLIAAHRSAAQIMLADERLTMSANLAAATGEQRWVDRYDENIPVIDAGIKAALDLAPPEAAERFDAETRAANDRLVQLERQAFAKALAGNRESAQAILDGRVYRYQKRVLGEGTDRFTDSMLAAVEAEFVALHRAAQWTFGLSIALALVGALALWRRLGHGHRRTESAYLAIEDRLKNLAMNDGLTGLPNRHSLQDALNAALRPSSPGRRFAVLCLDLDGFKSVNDSLGHLVGDELLRQVARRLEACLQPGDLVARLGGDEFAILQFLSHGPEEARDMAARVIEAVTAPFDICGHRVTIGGSLGLTLSGHPDDDAMTLLKQADLAMYRSKQEARGDYRFFDDDMLADAERRHDIEQGLRQAILRGELELYCQPLVCVASGTVSGYEALLRWNHPVRGLVSPVDFIPVAEQTGLILPIGDWVLRQACAMAQTWPAPLKIAVNVSTLQLRQKTFLNSVINALAATGLSPRRLEIEITESVVLSESSDIAATLNCLNSLGVSIAIDDFGTGYSSLSYLRTLPCSKIKIDRSFIKALETGGEDALAIVRSVINLARALHLDIVAEGVETEAQLDMVRAEGCTEYQGFLVGRPIPIAAITRSTDAQATVSAVA